METHQKRMSKRKMKNSLDENAKDKMEKALQDYKNNDKPLKEFYTLMQELDLWLKNKVAK